MGLLQVFWKRSLNNDEKAEKERARTEQKVAKTTEEVVAAIGRLRIQDRQFRELDNHDDDTGMMDWISSFTQTTRGTYNVLTPKAQASLGWMIRRGYRAYKTGHQKVYDFVSADLVEIYGIVVPMMPPKQEPDVYTLPIQQKPGSQMPEQKLLP